MAVVALAALAGALLHLAAAASSYEQAAPIVYEPATDEEVAAYFAEGEPVVRCIAADTASGCR